MASSFDFNAFSCVARLTRDPEDKTFSGGGRVVKFGIAFTGERRKNKDTGEWDDFPVFLDAEIFAFGDNQRDCDFAMKWLAKGKRVHLAGSLKMEQWEDKQTGQKRSAVKFKVTHVCPIDTDHVERGGGSHRDSAGGTRSGRAGGGGHSFDDGDFGGGDVPRKGDPIPF